MSPRRHPGQAGREQRAAAAKEKVAEATDRIDKQVAELRDGDSWRQFLHQAAQFHDYSFNNVLLIAAQRPHATRVASYQTWQKLDRQVQRGERGMRIIAPLRSMVPQTDQDGNTVTNDAGEPVKVPQVRGWTTASVFDVSQTDGEPLATPPAPASLHGDAPAGMWEALQHTADQLGYSVTVQPAGEAATDGMTRFADYSIHVSGSLAPAEQAATLAHELGHVVLHEPGVNQDQDTAHCRGYREVEAESVAMIVSEQWGVDTADMSVPYIAGWLQDVPDDQRSTAVRQSGDRIVTGAHSLITATQDRDVSHLLGRVQHGREQLSGRDQAADHKDEAARDPSRDTAPRQIPDPARTATEQYRQLVSEGRAIDSMTLGVEGNDAAAQEARANAAEAIRAELTSHRQAYWTGQVDDRPPDVMFGLENIRAHGGNIDAALADDARVGSDIAERLGYAPENLADPDRSTAAGDDRARVQVWQEAVSQLRADLHADSPQLSGDSEQVRVWANDRETQLRQETTQQPEPAVDSRGRSGSDGVEVSAAELRDMNVRAQQYWRSQLEGSWVPDTLAGRYGIDTGQDDRVGYAPDEWRGVVNLLRQAGYTDDTIKASGLGRDAAGGRIIDTFRDRAMVTVADGDGPVGFVGRRNPGRDDDPKAGPKYLNTKETDLYQKKATLVGVEGGQLRSDTGQATEASTSIPSAVVCEGPMDALAVDHDLGPDYRGVATCGTAFTAEQGEAVASASQGRPVVVATDGDKAGLKAADRIHADLAPRGLDTRWAVMPEGADPGSLAADPRSGAESLRAAADNAAPMTTGLVVRYLDETPWRDPQGHAEWMQNQEKVAQIIGRDTNPDRQAEAGRAAHMVAGWDSGDIAVAVGEVTAAAGGQQPSVQPRSRTGPDPPTADRATNGDRSQPASQPARQGPAFEELSEQAKRADAMGEKSVPARGGVAPTSSHQTPSMSSSAAQTARQIGGRYDGHGR